MRLGKEERFYGGINPDFHKVYQEKIVENDKRNAIIIKLANEMKDKACLIIVERIEHGKTLSSMIPGSVFVNGEDMTSNENKKEIENFNLNKINCLVSTSGICGEGIDIPRAELLIMAGAFKAKSQVVQKIGRILRLSDGKKEAIVIDFDDANLPFLEAHSKQRIKIYKTYNTEIKFFDV
jgi:superfamily II DNA or RNA helicase